MNSKLCTFLLTLGLATTVAACGTDDLSAGEAPTGTDITAVALEEVAQAIEGLDLADAEIWATERGLSIRVVEADGVPFAVTQDYSTSRINVATTDGVVSTVTGLG